MDEVAVSRRKHTNKKGNKENAQPADGSKSFIKREFSKTSAAPLQLKRNEKKETLVKSGPLKATVKQADTRSTSGEVLKKVKSVQRDGKAAAAGDAKRRQSHSQAFLTEQAMKHRKLAAEAPKPPAAVPSSKPAPGMYKGKIIQSKIGSIWKSSTTVGEADPKPTAPKPNFTTSRSKSVTDLHGRGTQKPAPVYRCKSVLDGPVHVSKPAVPSSRPPTAFRSARPPARTAPATLTGTSSRNTTVAPTKRSGTQNSKAKIPVTDKKVNKPPAVSTTSQYRFTVETAEERRAKLADWLASKGKTFKRPAMTAAPAPSKTKVSAKPEADLKPQSHSHAESPEPEPEPSLEAQKPDSPAALCADTQREEVTTYSQTPAIMNTTLDLLENSDPDLPVDPQYRVDDIVVNLCDALDAMETPSRCTDDLSQVTDECSSVKMEDKCEKMELKNEQKVETDDDDDDEEVESDEDVMETMPQMKDASVVKYSVKTTPYLQSVKKTIEGEVCTTGSRRKSNIKDLKFLTPVRRSCRIERKSSRLPSMLVDHDPCVSSLAELVKMDDDPNAYIYRKNPALLEDLPDQPKQ